MRMIGLVALCYLIGIGSSIASGCLKGLKYAEEIGGQATLSNGEIIEFDFIRGGVHVPEPMEIILDGRKLEIPFKNIYKVEVVGKKKILNEGAEVRVSLVNGNVGVGELQSAWMLLATLFWRDDFVGDMTCARYNFGIADRNLGEVYIQSMTFTNNRTEHSTLNRELTPQDKRLSKKLLELLGSPHITDVLVHDNGEKGIRKIDLIVKESARKFSSNIKNEVIAFFASKALKGSAGVLGLVSEPEIDSTGTLTMKVRIPFIFIKGESDSI